MIFVNNVIYENIYLKLSDLMFSMKFYRCNQSEKNIATWTIK